MNKKSSNILPRLLAAILLVPLVFGPLSDCAAWVQASPSAGASAQPAAQPAVKPITQPAVQPVSQPAAQPAAQPAVQPAARPPAQPAAAKPAPAKAAGPIISEQVLSNGLKVILLEDHSFPVVSCMTWYKVGSRNERAGNTGITHLLEHMLFGNVGTFRSGEIGSAIARVGGQFNGYTSDDFTTFFETLPASKLELALKIESERMRGARFTDADVQDELTNIQREFENEGKDPISALSQEVRSMLYVHHPYHNPTMGWRSDVDALTAAQLKEYYDKYFHPNNCTLVLAGAFESARATALIERYFGLVPRSPKPIPQIKLAQEPQKSERRSSMKFAGKQEILQMAFHAPAMEDADAPAMVILEKLLNAPMGGRLKSKLLEAKACQSANCAFELKKDPGLLSITAVAVPGTAGAQQKIIDSLDAMISQLRLQPISEAELRRARNQAEFAYYSEREGPYRAGFHLGFFENLTSWRHGEAWAQKLREVSAADVQRVSKKYLNTEGRVIVWLAGNNAAKPVAPKSDPTTTPAKPLVRPEHTRLTGFKEDDNATSPRGMKFTVLEQSKPPAPTPDKQPESKNTDASREAIKHLPEALPAAVQNLPSAVGKAAPELIRNLPNAVEAVPSVIKNIPSAVGNIPSVIRQLPSTVGSIPGAIKELPGAIGGMPGAAAHAVKELPGAIGGIPGSAASTLKELPGAIGGIPAATAGAIKSVPSAINTFANDLTGIPNAIGRQLSGAPQRHHGSVTRHTLSNGMTLIVHRSALAPVVQIHGAIKAGDAYDLPGKRGISAVTTAILNQGTARRSRIQVVTRQEDLGIQPQHMLHFENDAEVIQFKSRCLARDISEQLELLAETLTNPALSDADVERARQETISEIQKAEESISTKADRAMYRSLLAHGSPFCPDDPAELVKSISSFTAADLRKFVNTSVVPAAGTLVMVGDIEPARAQQLAESAFASWNARGTPQKLSAHINSKHVLRASVPVKDKHKATVGFGKLLPVPFNSQDYGNVLIADTIFSKHPLISRLGQKLSHDESFARVIGSDSLDTNLTHLADSLAWSFSADVEPNSVPMAVTALQTELKQLSEKGISQQEFVEARRFLLGSIPVRSMSTLSTVSKTLLTGALRSPSGDGQHALISHLRTADLESVNKAIRHTMKPETSMLVVVGNSQSIRASRNRFSSARNSAPEGVSGAAVDSEPASPTETPSD